MKKGISIEEAKEILKAYDFGFTGYAGSLKDAIDTVLPIVEKYQKIQQIVSAWNDMNSWDSMQEISKVVEDGNDG